MLGWPMPKRPSRTKKVAANAKAAPGGRQGAAAPGELHQRERRDNLTNKAILAKFQGRKSV